MNKSRITYLIILFLSFIYIYFDGGFLPYTLFYIVLLLPVASIIYLIIVYNTFKYVEKLDKREYKKGEMLDYTLKIENNTPLFIAYFTVYMHMEGQMLIKGMKNEHLTLKPFSKQEFSFNVPILYRGKYKVGISHIEVRDFLNLISVKYAPGETKLIRVFPRILPMEQYKIRYVRVAENEYLSHNKEAGHSEIRNIREYMYGDSLKKIHWKLSSKYNKWLVKETTASSEKELWILLNLAQFYGESEYVLGIEDRTIEVLLSIARVLLGLGINIKLCFFRSEQICLTISNMNGFHQLYELLAFMPFDQAAHFEDVIDYFNDTMPERQSVLFFSPIADGQQIDSLYKMANSGHDVSFFYCDVADGEMKKELIRVLERELPELGIEAINMLEMFGDIAQDIEHDKSSAV